MNMTFKVLDMCKTCTHGKTLPSHYQTRCARYASARFAMELLPVKMLADKNQTEAVIACNEYEESDDPIAIEQPRDFTLADALTMIKEHCNDQIDCKDCRIYPWCKDRDKNPEDWFVYEEEEGDVCKNT